MSQLSLLPVVSVVDGQPMASSVDVASYFLRQHRHVLRDIRGLSKSGQSPSFVSKNFILSSYRNSQEKEQPMFFMTKDGFTLLVMGFTGPKAMDFKIAYIAAFNTMAERLSRLSDAETLARGRLEAATRLVGSRAALADAALALLEEGLTQRQAAELLHVSRHVVYRLKRRFGFLASATMQEAVA